MILRFFFFLLFFFLISCTNNRKDNDKLYTKIHGVLYKDHSNKYYFRYAIPHRINKKGVDVGKTHYVYDSIISLDDSIVVIKDIIDIESIYTTNDGNLADKNYVFIQYETNIRPKFYIHKKNFN